jgi:hypothetical protein
LTLIPRPPAPGISLTLLLPLSRPTLGDLIFLAPGGVSFSCGENCSPAARFPWLDNFFQKGDELDLTTKIAILPTLPFAPLLPQPLSCLVSVSGVLPPVLHSLIRMARISALIAANCPLSRLFCRARSGSLRTSISWSYAVRSSNLRHLVVLELEYI